MRQQRIGFDGVSIFLIPGKHQQRLTVQAFRQIFPTKLNDVMTFALTLAGV
ncbi:hypothetical protein D3C81_2294890 [compost metagenome]